MSGLEIIGIILGLYPIVVGLAKAYKKSRGNDELHRTLMVASQLYEKTVKDLLGCVAIPHREMQRLAPSNGKVNVNLWKDPGLQQRLQDRIGPMKLDLAMRDLSEIKKLLDQVESDLMNMSRATDGMDILDRVRTKAKIAVSHMPQSKFQERVKRVRTLIDDLREVLDDRPVIRPHQQYVEESAIILNVEMTETGGVRACEFYEAVKKTYTCACLRPHPIGLGCYCTVCVQPLSKKAKLDLHSADEWEFCLAFPPNMDSFSDRAPTTVLLQSIPEADPAGGEAEPVHDICSLVRGVTGDSKVTEVLIDTTKPADTKAHRMKVAKISGPSDTKHELFRVQSFAELRCDADLSRKDRLELAIRLNLTILQLCKTPWINETWTWNDVCVSQVTTTTTTTHTSTQKVDDEKGSASPVEENPPVIANSQSIESQSPVMFFLREIYSVTYDGETASTAATIVTAPRTVDIMDEEPIMTKLGMALIELALGKSIQDMKERYGLDVIPEEDVANICTARKLLHEGKIRNEANKTYEGVVKACINRQFHDGVGTLKALASKDASFLSSFRDAIIVPLYQLWNTH